MEAIESNVEQSSVLSDEDGPCSELDDLNPSPADTENGQYLAFFVVLMLWRNLISKYILNRKR